MKKGLIILIVVIVVILFAWLSTYNSLVAKNESITQKQSEIDNQLKRRADLIPNLISTVKGLTSQEQKLVDSVTSARAKMNSGTTQEKLNANTELTRNINVLMENYPTLKSDTAFVSLMDELSGTENRIAVARKNYNDDVKLFNTYIKTFPTNIVASISNFNEKVYLEVSETDKQLPKVEF
jgi:LemA protein